MKVSADSLLSVINDVLDFSKIEAGKLDLDRVEFRPRELLRDTVKAMEVLAPHQETGTPCHVPEPVPERLLGDPSRLRQVLINLIGNAIKFTAEGSVEVDLCGAPGAPTADAVELRIRGATTAGSAFPRTSRS